MNETGDTEGCIACDLSSGRTRLVGGRIFAADGWIVEHCMGPLGVGTFIVKPARHILHFWELEEPELAALGPLLGKASSVLRELTDCDQVYVCLWSHGNFVPVHIHFVVQAVSNEMKTSYDNAGPALQTEMFRRGEQPDVRAVEILCERARGMFHDDTL